MSNDRRPVKQALKDYYADKSLSGIQLQALQQTLDQADVSNEQNDPGFNRQRTFKWLGSVAASLMLLVLIMSYSQTPELISSAYADIGKDAHLNNGMRPSMLQWLNENNISDVPPQYPIKMSKFCRLDQLMATHLRIAGKEQGEVNLFFHHGNRPLHWFDGSGTINDMNWRLVKVRKNLTLIVLYTQDMREKSVQHILHEMLPELEV